MDLQQWFYILGIAYIASWLIILIGLVIVGVVAYRRYQQLKREVATQGAFFFATSRVLKQLPLERIVPIVGAIPLATKILQMITGKKRKTSHEE